MKHYINVIQINSVSVHSLYFDPPPNGNIGYIFKGIPT